MTNGKKCIVGQAAGGKMRAGERKGISGEEDGLKIGWGLIEKSRRAHVRTQVMRWLKSERRITGGRQRLAARWEEDTTKIVGGKTRGLFLDGDSDEIRIICSNNFREMGDNAG